MQNKGVRKSFRCFFINFPTNFCQKKSSMDSFGWVSYDKRPEWQDIAPTFQTEDERSVVNIAYSEKFAIVFAYFRTILQVEEKSERAFQLTKDAALLNPANYTVWKYRRDIINELNKDLKDELNFCRSVIEENPKNYQVWHHLRLLVEQSQNFSEELSFTDSILKDDSKNYHAWQHRQWVIKTYNLWSNELNYCSELINEDIHNNSAWNYRFFVISSTTGFTIEVIERETKLAQELIRKAPHNESAWNYLTGILDHADDSVKLSAWNFSSNLYNEQNCRSPHLLVFMISCLKQNSAKPGYNLTEINSEACRLLGELQEVDPVRINYWRYLRQDFDKDS